MTAVPITLAKTRETAATVERFYRPELDGLRFLAFFAVFLSHALPSRVVQWQRLGVDEGAANWLTTIVSSGSFGVDLFFCLSAYLITELLLREHEQFGRLDPWRFWIRRTLRIWPLYYAFVLFAALPVMTSVLRGPDLLSFLFFVGNWQCAFNGYPASVAAPLWSVSIEEQFYLFWPWLVLFVTPARLAHACLGMIAIAMATRASLAFSEAAHPATWCNSLARLDSIALGALVAVGLRKRPLRIGPSWRAAMMVVAPVLVVILARIAPPNPKFATWSLVWLYLLVDLVFAVLLVTVLSGAARGSQSSGWLTHPIMVYLGRISYGLYVVHALGLKLGASATVRFIPALGLPGRVLLGLAVTVALASISYFTLERPFLRLKARFARVASRPD